MVFYHYYPFEYPFFLLKQGINASYLPFGLVDAKSCNIFWPFHDVLFKSEKTVWKKVFILCIKKKQITEHKIHLKLHWYLPFLDLDTNLLTFHCHIIFHLTYELVKVLQNINRDVCSDKLLWLGYIPPSIIM